MSSPARPRLTWIDLLRGVAVVGMLETHVMNVFLDSTYDHAEWRHQLSFYNGLLAPAFLWIAGYIQGLSIRKALRNGQPVVTMPRLRRLGLVAFLGYFLHMPWHLWAQGDFGAESWRIALQADILQCMAVSLILLLVVGMAGSRWFDLLTLALAGFFVMAAPAVQQWHTGLVFLDPFINHDSGSLFPLFPWVGFCAVGSLASRWEVSWRTLLPTALGLIALAMIFKPTGYSYVHPSFFAERLGWLGLLITLIWLVSQRFAPAWLQLAGRESLFIYVSHLILLYSFPYHGTTLNLWIGRTISIPATTAVFLLVLLLCLGFAWLNEKRKLRAQAKIPKTD